VFERVVRDFALNIVNFMVTLATLFIGSTPKQDQNYHLYPMQEENQSWWDGVV